MFYLYKHMINIYTANYQTEAVTNKSLCIIRIKSILLNFNNSFSLKKNHPLRFATLRFGILSILFFAFVQEVSSQHSNLVNHTNHFTTTNCTALTPTVTAGGVTTFCAGGSVTLTSSSATSYLWSTGSTTQSISVSSTGSYTVIITDATGCVSAPSAATIVTVYAPPFAPTITAGGPTSFCSGGNVSLTSSSGITYLWSNGATTQSINANSSGNYTVKVTNANGCQSAVSTEKIITVNALPPPPAITASGPTSFCTGGSVTLTSDAGTNYLWSTGATSQNINVAASGNYTVMITDANGCQSVASAITAVSVNSPPVVNAGTNVTIAAGTSTTIDATVTGTGPFTYSWSPSGQLLNALIEDPKTINLSATTLYTLTATSSTTSCSNTGTVIISVSGNALSSNATASQTTVCAGTSVQLNALASGGTGSYIYFWTSTPAGYFSFSANPVINPAVSRTYNVSINDGSNVVNSSVLVNVNALPATPTITASGATTFCAGGNVTLTSSVGSSYLWSNGATTQSTTLTSAGSYTVRVTNASGCLSAASTNSVITVNSLPITPTITAGGATSFCAGGSVTLTSAAATTYLWSSGEITQSINTGTGGSYSVIVRNASGCASAASVPTIVTVNALPPKPTVTASGVTTFCMGDRVKLTSSPATTYLWSNGASTPDVNITTSGSYTVVTTNPSGCQSPTSLATVVNVNALPFTPTITTSGPTTFCAGGSVTLTSSLGSSYLWSNGATTQSINITESGSYSVMIKNGSGCESAASTATIVTVNNLPSIPLLTASGPTTFCYGGSVTLTSSPEAIYLWSDNSGNQDLVVTSSGNYTVTVTNANGCQSAASLATLVTVNPLPATPTITAAGPTTFCAGGNVNLTSSLNTSYLWSNGAITPGISVTTSGNYTVRVTNTNGCQSIASAPTLVTVNALPVTPTITSGGPTTFCAGGSVNLTSSLGTSYLWSTGATTPGINITATGNYTVQVTNANGCQSVASVPTIVTVNTLPVTPTITTSGTTTFCEGGNVNLTSSAGTTYIWSTGETTSEINIIISGNYFVKVTNANGCLSAASIVTLVTVNPLPAKPTITAGGSTTFCAGGNVTLTSVPATTYLWSTGATTPNITITESGSYSVKVTNVNGCQSIASDPSVVTVNPLPVAPTIIAGSATTFCDGGSVNLSSSAGASYLWSTGATTQGITIASSGSFFVQVTDANGCQSAASDATSVTVNPLPITPVITPDGSTTFCAGGNVILTSGLGTTYIWSTGATTPGINITESGSYFVKVTNDNGCQSAASLSVTVTVNPLPVAPTITPGGPTTFCEGNTVILTSGTGTTYLWSNGAITQGINVSLSGSYSVQITDENGCRSASSELVSVTVNPLPEKPIISASDATTFCDGGNVTLSSSSGSAYLWSTGAETKDLIISTTGNYSVIITDAKGCKSLVSSLLTVTVNPLPATPTITAGGAVSFCIGGNVTLSSSASTGYQWSTGAVTGSINVAQTGNYSVIVTDANGCHSAQTLAMQVTVNPLPVPVIATSGSTTICKGATVTLTASGGSSYHWSSGETLAAITVGTAGNFVVTATDDNGCTNTAQKLVTVIITEANAGSGGDACGKIFKLNATSGPGTGKWSVNSGAGSVTFSPDENNPSATARITEYGIYNFEWKVINQNCPDSSAVTVTYHAIPIANAGVDQLLNYTFNSKMEAALSSSETGVWSLISGSGSIDGIDSPVASVSGLSVGYNLFLWEVTSEGCSASDTVNIKVNDLFVPQVITPNGDQKNDFFVIKGIENNGPAELTILNRSGKQVYYNPNYTNDWDGKTNKREELANGTYFFVLKLSDNTITRGYVVIKR